MKRVPKIFVVFVSFFCLNNLAFAQTEEEMPPGENQTKEEVPPRRESNRTEPANALEQKECYPPCRAGYFCKDGGCVSECNPPCSDGYVCRNSDCVPIHVPRASYPPMQPVVDVMIDQKSVVGAFFLEFFLGFGIGNYYAGSVGAGVLGTLSSTAMIIGAVAVTQTTGSSSQAGLALFVPGAVGQLVSLVLAPINATNYNEKLRNDYLRRSNLSFSDPPMRNNISFHKHDHWVADANPMLFGIGLPPIRW